MADIAVPYERQKTDADLTEIIDRSDAGISVLDQLGTAYQSLPGYAMTALQALNQELKDDQTLLEGLITQILPVLQRLDVNAAQMQELNKGLLPLLRGALLGKPEAVLLDRITGPTEQGHPATPTNP